MTRSKQRSGFGSIWNAIRYTLYLPIYDLVAAPFAPMRKHSINQLNWNGNEHVLILGAGSGLDFRHLPKVKHVDAIDIAPGMLLLMQLRSRNKPEVHPQLMNGQSLMFENETFDVVILHLILAVIPNPVLALQEAERVTKLGGKILVMDKFASSEKSTVLRKLINIPASILATSITRDVNTIVSQTSLEVKQKKPAALSGLFQYVVLQKPMA